MPAQKPAVLNKCLHIILVLVLCIQTSAYTQERNFKNKIDPAFLSLIDIANGRVPKSLAQNQIQPTEGFAPNSRAVEKRYDCIIYSSNTKALKDSGIVINSTVGNFATAWVTLDEVVRLSAMPGLRYIQSPVQMRVQNDIAVSSSGASLLHQGRLNNTAYKGKGVIIGIYDTGVDWDHLDFRDPVDTTKSRILRIWDQTLTATGAESLPDGFSYGVEYTQSQINDELDGSPTHFVRQKDINGHGTSVAGTAAGNGATLPSRKYMGMAPEADIVVIKGSDLYFTENRLVDGLAYLDKLATSLGKAAVMNFSIAQQYGPHDGSRAPEVAIDSFSARRGRVVTVAGGNDHGPKVHKRLTLPPNGTDRFIVAVSDKEQADLFRLEIYGQQNSNITATVTAPDGTVIRGFAGSTTTGLVQKDSFEINLINDIDYANNNSFVRVTINRPFNHTAKATGVWTIAITNNSSSNLLLDGWLYYPDLYYLATTLLGGDDNFMVSTPGMAGSAITAGSYAAKGKYYSVPEMLAVSRYVFRDSISVFSNWGPRRDGLLKPEIVADGEEVATTLSSDCVVTSTEVIQAGVYSARKGTSLASPGVAGAAALLLQANPQATAAEIKGWITSGAGKDLFTESSGQTPNTIWGHGKLDVFKAASLLFNCAPADRRSTLFPVAEDVAVSIAPTIQVAKKITAELTGKLSGFFFHTADLPVLSLMIEVRLPTNAGAPGDLIGSLKIDGLDVARHSQNYADLSRLNISMTNGKDYFIVLKAVAPGSVSWGLMANNSLNLNRSIISTDFGTTWSVVNTEFVIRSIIYNNAQSSGTIANTFSSDSRNVSTSNQFINNNCQLIAQITPSGNLPVNGNVTGKVWIEGSVPDYLSMPYVQRHYEVNAATGSSNATGKVTLYFLQSEFNAFNISPNRILTLPVNPTDNVGKSNLRVRKFTGISIDGSGLPASYSGPNTIIDPDDSDVIWNEEAKRWEVSFDVTGFSGFIVQTSQTILPLLVEYFKGDALPGANLLNWKLNCLNTAPVFTMERSSNGIDFSSLARISTTENNCDRPYQYRDDGPLPGNNFYRIKIDERAGNAIYTETILLHQASDGKDRLYPNVIARGESVQVNFSGTKGLLLINDATGKEVFRKPLLHGNQRIQAGLTSGSLYFYTITDGNGISNFGKIIVK